MSAAGAAREAAPVFRAPVGTGRHRAPRPRLG